MNYPVVVGQTPPSTGDKWKYALAGAATFALLDVVVNGTLLGVKLTKKARRKRR